MGFPGLLLLQPPENLVCYTFLEGRCEPAEQAKQPPARKAIASWRFALLATTS